MSFIDQLVCWTIIAGALFSLHWTGWHSHDKATYKAAGLPTIILLVAAIGVLIRLFYFGER